MRLIRKLAKTRIGEGVFVIPPQEMSVMSYLTIGRLNRAIAGKEDLGKKDKNMCKLVIAGFVTQIESTEQFTLDDGTGTYPVKLVEGLSVKLGSCVRVFAVTNKTNVFRPINAEILHDGEQFLLHMMDCANSCNEAGILAPVQPEQNFNNFMDGLATFE